MKCGKCGVENAPGTEYCVSCGQELSSCLAVHVSVCANHPNKVATSTCALCGIELCEVCERFVGSQIYCADCLERPVEAKESTQRIESPSVMAAPFMLRAFAAVLDAAVLGVGMATLAVCFWLVTENPYIPFDRKSLWFFVYWLIVSGGIPLYFISFIGSSAQTPGMSVFDLAVLRYDGTFPGWKLAAARYFASILSVMLIFGMLMPLWDSRRRMWHDKIAHTVMIKVG